ncbi:MAG: hypothetical protein ACLUEV_04460 [Alistipes sp.]
MRVIPGETRIRTVLPDGSHPSEAGTLLAANVIFSVIYGKPYASEIRAGVPQQQAEYLRQVAQQTVFDNLRLINVEPVAPGPLPEIALPRK